MTQESWKRETDETDCKIPEGITLCVNNCGLFGSAITLNMCAKCYAESLLKKPNPPTPSSVSSPPSLPSSFSSLPSSSSGIDTRGKLSEKPKLESEAFRCSSCQKKVGLTGFRCRCGDLFCGRHRYSDAHECSYDYKAAGKQAIARENPAVRAAKIIKI